MGGTATDVDATFVSGRSSGAPSGDARVVWAKDISEETYSVGGWRLYRSSSRITSRLRNVKGSSESSARSTANSDVSGRLEFSMPVS